MAISPYSPSEFRARYEKDGVLILRNVLSQRNLSNLENQVRAIVEHKGKPGETIDETVIRLDKQDRGSLYQINLAIDKSYEFGAIREDFMDGMNELYPDHGYLTVDTFMIFGLPRDKRLAFEWHQDTVYLPNLSNYTNFWITLFSDATPECGTLSILKGSHKMGDFDVYTEKSEPEAYRQYIPKNWKDLVEDYEEVHIQTSPGDVAVFHPAIVHRSNFNTSNKVRFSLVTRIAAIKNEFPRQIAFNDSHRNFTW